MTQQEELRITLFKLEELIQELGLLLLALRRLSGLPQEEQADRPDFDYHTGMPPKRGQ